MVPATGAGVIMLIPSSRPTTIKVTAALFATIALAFSILTFVAYDYAEGGYQFQRQWQWVESLGISVHLGVDGISVPMVLLTGIVMFTGVFISWNINTRTKDFFILFMALVTGVYGTFVSLDLFFLFFFYELAILPMYLLIAVWGSTRKEYAALKLVLYLVAGSVLVWVALIAVYVKANLGTFDLLALQDVEFARDFQTIFFPLFLIGFGILAGLWPFHTWSPDGHAAAPTAVSMLHAGVLMKLGAYGIIRVGMTLFPEGFDAWQVPFIVLATINVLYGAMAAMAQRDLKYVIAYSSVSHMGYVLMGFATMDRVGINGAMLQMFSHGIMTALFFALVGVIYDRTHTRDISIFQGLSKRMGITAVFFTVAGLTSLGLPGLSGFVAEFLVFVGAFRTYPVVGVLGILGAALTAVYILRLLAQIFFGPLEAQWERLPDATRLEALAMGVLVIMLVLVGVYPAPFMNIINSGVTTLVARIVEVV